MEFLSSINRDRARVEAFLAEFTARAAGAIVEPEVAVGMFTLPGRQAASGAAAPATRARRLRSARAPAHRR